MLYWWWIRCNRAREAAEHVCALCPHCKTLVLHHSWRHHCQAQEVMRLLVTSLIRIQTRFIPLSLFPNHKWLLWSLCFMNVCVRSSHVFSLVTRQPKRFHPAPPRRASDDPLKVGGRGRGREGDADSFTSFGSMWGILLEPWLCCWGARLTQTDTHGSGLVPKKTFIILQLLTFFSPRLRSL